jgi:hypothetical protein
MAPKAMNTIMIMSIIMTMDTIIRTIMATVCIIITTTIIFIRMTRFPKAPPATCISVKDRQELMFRA